MEEIVHPIAALFDFDGVVVDSESQYSAFWQGQGKLYHPEIPDFSGVVKGTTLVQIFDKYFAGMEAVQQKIQQELTLFEQNMSFAYIPGIVSFLKELRSHDVRLAVVTSSNRAKMENVLLVHPELSCLFDRILMSEDFSRSKPFPDCYLLGAEVFQTVPERCFVFEDSFNGLKSGNAAGMKVIGLSTTNPAEAIKDMCLAVIPDFRDFSYERMMRLLAH